MSKVCFSAYKPFFFVYVQHCHRLLLLVALFVQQMMLFRGILQTDWHVECNSVGRWDSASCSQGYDFKERNHKISSTSSINAKSWSYLSGDLHRLNHWFSLHFYTWKRGNDDLHSNFSLWQNAVGGVSLLWKLKHKQFVFLFFVLLICMGVV